MILISQLMPSARFFFGGYVYVVQTEDRDGKQVLLTDKQTGAVAVKRWDFATGSVTKDYTHFSPHQPVEQVLG